MQEVRSSILLSSTIGFILRIPSLARGGISGFGTFVPDRAHFLTPGLAGRRRRTGYKP